MNGVIRRHIKFGRDDAIIHNFITRYDNFVDDVGSMLLVRSMMPAL
jgi:hypothetical protein